LNLYSLFDRPELDRSSTFISRPGRPPVTYGQAFEAAARVANALVERGLGPGDRVAVQVEKSAEAIFLYLGCLRAGLVFLPLNTAYKLTELEYFIGDASPGLVVASSASAPELSKICTRLGIEHLETLNGDGSGSLFELVNRQATVHTVVERSEDDLAALLYTSGTTGRSKGAMLTHGNLASNCSALKTLWQFSEKDVLLHALPIFHTHGLFVALNVALCAGASVLLVGSFNAREVVQLLPQVTCMMGVPTFYTRLLDENSLNRETTGNVRLFVSGSAPLLSETHVAWEQRTGHAILERYGMTETNMNASNPYSGPRRAGTVGLPLPGVEIRIADEEGRAVSQGQVGMIQIRGPNVFKGYWNMPAKTAEEFTADGYFISGDLGRFDEDGYLSIVGRAKDLIISGGYNVYPKEVEIEIDLIPGVMESAVVGLPHPDFGEGVVAIVVPTAEGGAQENEIIAALRGRLAAYKLPKRVFCVSELPRNTMGKVQKNLLRDRYLGEFRV
jgi:malonyl-CoA/methylmalonyl-CoA synthetase